GAMDKPESPLWGPLHAPHHWGESWFGYYLAQDAAVLRKHAQMLADAGVDVVVFDVTNQVTYRDDYMALLREWAAWRAMGNPTPQVAFLTPFWDPPKVVRELWHDLYRPGLHSDLWFRWEGKPLLLADVDRLGTWKGFVDGNEPVELRPGSTLGQTFRVDEGVRGVAGRFPTWRTTGAAVTLALKKDGPGGERIASERFHDVEDNAWLRLRLDAPLAPGTYYLEASEPGGRVGWWSRSEDRWSAGEAYAEGKAVAGDRAIRWDSTDPEADEIAKFFTFRAPQPDYFRGPTRPDMWSWLEVYPQHVFRNARGEKEQMSVGVAQNAVGDRLGSMSEPGARGRSFHRSATDTSPGAVRRGFNVMEQWERALAEDPRFVFVTGWNEWIAGRFAEFNRVKLPVMFVDQFDQEHSRDIEPMQGGHGDDYYYQFVGYVRRYKGARAPEVTVSKPIRIDGRFDDWEEVRPEFRDTRGDPVRRRHRGWDPKVEYVDASGRNDIVSAKASTDGKRTWFLVRTREPLRPAMEGRHRLLLLVDADADASTGWLGYDLLIGRRREAGRASVERNDGTGWAWREIGSAPAFESGDALELEIDWARMGWEAAPAVLDFKWADQIEGNGDASDFTLRGDVAPNDRFNYRYRGAAPRGSR
ncbi:MAG: hypothetical protein JNL97_01915, partial [Verrucomicrobiales bacterium]|nr:hypothetical protein [Verrucomicrobiales bacterium]